MEKPLESQLFNNLIANIGIERAKAIADYVEKKFEYEFQIAKETLVSKTRFENHEKEIEFKIEQCLSIKEEIESNIQSKVESVNDESLKNLFIKYKHFQDFCDEVEKQYIIYNLIENKWNVAETAKKIDIQRSHLYNKIKKYNLDRNSSY